jgi:hypothetical protein
MWQPELNGEEIEPLESAVYQALGAASMCWIPHPSGEFDSTRAKDIGDGLLAWMRAHEEAACSS